MIIDFNWFNQQGVKDVLSFVYTIVDIIRIIVPIVLIVMTTLDITKKVIDPEDKEGQKKIMTRAIAALIIFFIPTFINIVFKIADIDINNIKMNNTSSSSKKSNTTNTNVNNNTITVLSSININNCPSLANSFKPGDRFTLNTDIPSTYSGAITWIEDKANQKVFNIIPSSDNRSVTLEVVSNPTNSIADITVKAGGTSKTCSVLIDVPDKLSSISITNCPSYQIKYKPGDIITLSSDIPSSYTGKIEWIADSHNNTFILTPSSDNRSVTLKVIDNPTSSISTVTLYAEGKTKTCVLYIDTN